MTQFQSRKTEVEVEICRDLDIISPSSPWELDGDDEVRFRIDVETTPRNAANDLEYRWEVVRGDGEWENGRDTLEDRGDFTKTLEDPDSDTFVRVTALDQDGDEIARCTDSIRVEDDIPRRDQPEIEKFVRKDRGSNRTSIAADEDDDIYYSIKFTPGEDTQVAEISDTDLSRGRILSEERALDGYLELQQLTISIAEEGSDRNTEIFESRGRNSFDRALEDRYSCDEDNFEDGLSSNGRICISEYEDIYDNFTSGQEITFYNLDRLDSDEYILIEYEMENHSVISTEKCQELERNGGCGETFRNSRRIPII